MVLQTETRQEERVRAWSPQDLLMAGKSPGPKGQSAGSFVLDRADLKKAITLCSSCLPKFNTRSTGYITKRNLPFVQGRCDGCQTFVNRGHLLVHHTMANLS